MKKISVAIIEDSQEDYASLKRVLDKYSAEHEISFEVSHYGSAENFFDRDRFKKPVDILFLDIELPGINGISAAKKFREFNEEAVLIFVTNMRKFAIKGYEVGAMNYILKPINYYSFVMTLDKAVKSISGKKSEIIRIKTNSGFKVVDCNKIMYIDIMGHDVRFITTDEEIRTYGTLNEWEEKLSDLSFARCSSSAIVNFRYVEGIHGDYVSVGGTEIHIGRVKKKDFVKRLSNYYGDLV